MTAEPKEIRGRQMIVKHVTAAVLGDPRQERRAGDGWQPVGSHESSKARSDGTHGSWELIEGSRRVPCWTPGDRSSSVVAAVAMVTGCRWPMGETCDTEFHFCNDSRDGCSPYCAVHTGIAKGRK